MIFVPITTLRVRTYVHACIRTRTLYVPGGAFIKRVFDTSTGIVINVATPPCKAQTNTTSQLCFDIGDVYNYTILGNSCDKETSQEIRAYRCKAGAKMSDDVVLEDAGAQQ